MSDSEWVLSGLMILTVVSRLKAAWENWGLEAKVMATERELRQAGRRIKELQAELLQNQTLLQSRLFRSPALGETIPPKTQALIRLAAENPEKEEARTAAVEACKRLKRELG